MSKPSILSRTALRRRAGRLARRALRAEPTFSSPVAAEAMGLEVLGAAGLPVIVASHRRSGTHLTIDLLRRQFAACDAAKRLSESLDGVYVNLDRLGRHRSPISQARLTELVRRGQRPLFKTHLLPDFAPVRAVQGDWLDRLTERARIIYVVRDGRAVMASLRRHEAALGMPTGENFSDYIRRERDGRSRVHEWLEHVERWISTEGVYVLKYEDILSDGPRVLAGLGGLLGLPPRMVDPLAPPLIRSLWRKRVMRYTHRRPTTTALTPRTAPKRWRELFRPEDHLYFESIAGGLLEKLGYETTWSRATGALAARHRPAA